MRHTVVGSLAVLTMWLVGSASSASAQILIWSLPKDDGGWVRFEGDYRQTRARPNNNAGDEQLKWRSELSISSVGSEQVAIDSKQVKCRWVEFKTITKAPDLEQQPGPGGTYLYKVLIPEHRVSGLTTDDGDIPVTFLPIVKGYRKLGEGDVETVAAGALAVYPTVAPLTYYPDLKQDGDPVELLLKGVSERAVPTQVWKGSRVHESATVRSTNSATLWRSDVVPFGLAKFAATITREEKAADAPVEAFRRTSLIEVEMTAVAAGNNARSELASQR